MGDAMMRDKPIYRSIKAYLEAYPEAAWYGQFQRYIEREVHPYNNYMVKGWGPHDGFPGGYLSLRLIHRYCQNLYDIWAIVITDRDDGIIDREFDNEQDARSCLQDMLKLVPFAMRDITELGFSW